MHPTACLLLSSEHRVSPIVDGSLRRYHNQLLANYNGFHIFVSAQRLVHYRPHRCNYETTHHVVQYSRYFGQFSHTLSTTVSTGKHVENNAHNFGQLPTSLSLSIRVQTVSNKQDNTSASKLKRGFTRFLSSIRGWRHPFLFVNRGET